MDAITPKLEADSFGRSRVYLHQQVLAKGEGEDDSFAFLDTRAANRALIFLQLRSLDALSGETAELTVDMLNDAGDYAEPYAALDSLQAVATQLVPQTKLVAVENPGPYIGLNFTGGTSEKWEWKIWAELRG